MKDYAVVIGGSGGIGSEMAKLFNNKGITPIVVDRVRPDKTAYTYIECDLTKQGSIDGVIQQLQKINNGSIKYVINTAGVFEAHDDGLFDASRLRRVMDVNVSGTQTLLQLWYTHFGQRNGGVVLNISSAAARRGTSDVAYGISKAALDSATKSLARAWAPSEVWVFGLAPGLVDTSMAEPMKDQRRKRLAENSLIKRETTPQEVAELALAIMLSSPALVTGTIIDASGGIN